MMETSYVMPVTAHSNGHVHGHSHKSMPQRQPLQPTSLNGNPYMNGGQHYLEEGKQHAHTQSLHLHSHEESEKTRSEHTRSRSHLPPPSLPAMDAVNVRPKSMARRISVGLPTHLKLEGSNYGFQPARKPTYATSSEGVKRLVEKMSAILCRLLAF